MRKRWALPAVTALALGITGCGIFSDEHAGLDDINAACAALASHHYLAAQNRINHAVAADSRWGDLAWAIRAMALDWQSIGPNPPYPSREQAPKIVQRGCSDAAEEADKPPFVWSP